MLESIEKLRDSLGGYQVVTGEDMGAFLLHVDRIECEISEKYMELPVDADGVPIHVGDVIEQCGSEPCEVIGLTETQGCWVKGTHYAINANYAHHVKPDPVKELLGEFFRESRNFNLKDAPGTADRAIEEYAARIREAVKS